jgi:hypothetical protein
MHAQDQSAKCVNPDQPEGSIPHQWFRSSADFRNQFSARSTADLVIAGIDLSAKRFVVTDCNSDNGFQTMWALDQLSIDPMTSIEIYMLPHQASTA